MMSMDGLSRAWGPVFDAERVTQARRWQNYAVRSLFVLGLLLGLCLGVSAALGDGKLTVREMAQVGSSAYLMLTLLELAAVLLIGPAATAGAICLDKSRGSLAHVFVTDLTNREIILGKLAARLLPVWGLLACAVPVAAMATWLGGIDPIALTGGFLIATGVAVLGCSLALMLSVWARKPHEVISVVYGVWVLWIFACPVWQIFYQSPRSALWLERTNPVYLSIAPVGRPGETSIVEPILFCLGCFGIGAGFLAVAIAKVRVVACRSARVGVRRVGWVGRGLGWVRGQVRWGQGPKLDADPVLWREWHRNLPSRWSKFVWFGFDILSALSYLGMLLGWASGSLLVQSLMKSELPGVIVALLSTLGLLLVSTSAASVLAEERTQGSLDVLMTTPISTRAILAAKWRGSFRRVPWLAFWPVVLGIAHLSVTRQSLVEVALLELVPVLIAAQGAALVSLGLALATWIKRTGQATAWTITALIASVVGWPILSTLIYLENLVMWITSETVYHRDSLQNAVLRSALGMGSPLVNIASPTIYGIATGGRKSNDPLAILILEVSWTLFYGLVAWGLFELTVSTFDRCLGRIPERPSTPRLAPDPARPRGIGRLKGWGWKIPGGGGRRVGRAASFGPPPR